MQDSTNNPQEIHIGNFTLLGSPPDRAKLIAKLAAIQGAMTRVEKRGHNATQNYDFARESDVVDHVRPMLERASLAIVFSNEPLSVQYEHRESSKGTHQVWASLELRATIIDGETGALLSYTMPGQAVDSGSDKAIYKAITGAKKYATLLGFNVATGDDPENEDGRKNQRTRRANEPADPDAVAREESKARQQLCARFPLMRDETRRDEICHGFYGKSLSEMPIKELRDLYGKLNKGEIQ